MILMKIKMMRSQFLIYILLPAVDNRAVSQQPIQQSPD
jgi:hypothetical protein